MKIDYKKIGFKCGIEIHQRIASHEKLFCSCGTLNESEESNSSFYRRQRAVAGELGAVDAAAMHEQTRDRRFIYLSYPSYTCEVDEDQEPPHPLNQEALDIALQVALMLNASIVDEAQVMRKSVLDGSNTGGFQRTMMVALDGRLETPKGSVGIPNVSLEEEASAIQEERRGEVVYRLDRLGIPLVEIGTSPDIIDAEHCREVAEKLGLILRATGKVQRGIGTIRQDVNVSVEEGARVEIKGAQKLEDLPAIVENEVRRQLGLIEVRRELAQRGAKEFLFRCVEATEIFAETKSKLLLKSLDKKESVFALRLPNFEGLLGKEFYPGRRLGSELSDYAKTRGVGGIIHSDEKMEKYGITEEEVDRVKEAVGVNEGCAWVLIAGSEEKARKAAEEVHKRAIIAIKEVPEETRKVVNDTGTAYMRPLPGGARLYPETDVPPVRLTRERIESLEAVLPEMPGETLERLKKMLNDELARKIFRSQRLPAFNRILTKVKGADPTLVAATLEETMVGLKREGIDVDSLPDAKLDELFAEHFENKLFVKSAIPEIIKALCEHPESSVAEIVAEKSLARMTKEEVEEAVKQELVETKEKGLLIKRVMERLRLRAEGKDVVEAAKRLA